MEEKQKVMFEGEEILIDAPNTDGGTEGNPALADPELDKGQSAGQFPEGFLKKYEGKDKDALLKALHDQEKYIGQQGNKLNLRPDLKVERTSKVAEKEITDLETSIAKAKSELEKMDDVADFDAYDEKETSIKEQEKKLRKLNKDMIELKAEEIADRKYNKEHNDEFFSKERDSLKADFGVDVDDDAWETIVNYAKQLNGKGKVSKDSYMASLVLTLGADKVTGLLEAKQEASFRKNLKKSESNSSLFSSVKSEQGGTSSLSFDELSPEMKAKAIANMSDEQWQKYKRKMGLN